MPTTLQLRRGTTAENAAFTGAEGELTVDTQTNSLNVHDGSTVGGNAITGGGGASALTTKGDVATFSTVDARLPVGSDDQVLTADSAEATGVKWADAAGGPPAMVRAPYSASYTLLPDNISKFDGNSTRAGTNAAVYVPCYFHTPTVVTKLGFYVGVADAASTDTRVAIFQQHATTGLPDNMLFGSAHISVAATGFATETLGTPLTLHGFYWIGIKSDSATVELAHCNPSLSQITINPMGINPAGGTMRFPHTTSIVGAFASAPTYDGTYADNSSLWVPIYES